TKMKMTKQMTINKNQIKGLSILLISRTFERTAFYMIMSILILFLTKELNLETTKAGTFYSIFYGIITIVSLFSGLLGDLTNRIKVVKIGMLLMTILYFSLIFLPNSYLILLNGFILLGISLGLNNTNISVFVGSIFNEKNTQIIGLTGFILYSIVINIGALFAPMIATSLRDSFGFNSIFILAFILAGISFVLYLIFSKIYSKLDLFIERKNEFETEKKYRNINLAIFLFVIILGIFIRFILQQRELTFTFYIRDFVVNGFNFNENQKYLSIIFLLIFVVFTLIIRKLNWNKIFKIVLVGTIFGFIAYSLASTFKATDVEKISQLPIQIVFIFLVISETILYPTISYIIYRSSPIKFKGLFQGISYTIVSSQLLIFGIRIYEKTNPNITFLIFSLILLISAISIIIFTKFIKNKESKLLEIDE
ncbi:MAG TPA: hypothetical protein DCQ31_13300, partial [Bacteroidales bacterium]|nr:hypothetical protein [Bacteroidales bacterium]